MLCYLLFFFIEYNTRDYSVCINEHLLCHSKHKSLIIKTTSKFYFFRSIVSKWSLFKSQWKSAVKFYTNQIYYDCPIFQIPLTWISLKKKKQYRCMFYQCSQSCYDIRIVIRLVHERIFLQFCSLCMVCQCSQLCYETRIITDCNIENQKTIISLRKHYKLLYTLNFQILQNNVAEQRWDRAAKQQIIWQLQ